MGAAGGRPHLRSRSRFLGMHRCSRVAIMARGELMCIGSQQHLKVRGVCRRTDAGVRLTAARAGPLWPRFQAVSEPPVWRVWRVWRRGGTRSCVPGLACLARIAVVRRGGPFRALDGVRGSGARVLHGVQRGIHAAQGARSGARGAKAGGAAARRRRWLARRRRLSTCSKPSRRGTRASGFLSGACHKRRWRKCSSQSHESPRRAARSCRDRRVCAFKCTLTLIIPP